MRQMIKIPKRRKGNCKNTNLVLNQYDRATSFSFANPTLKLNVNNVRGEPHGGSRYTTTPLPQPATHSPRQPDHPVPSPSSKEPEERKASGVEMFPSQPQLRVPPPPPQPPRSGERTLRKEFVPGTMVGKSSLNDRRKEQQKPRKVRCVFKSQKVQID